MKILYCNIAGYNIKLIFQEAGSKQSQESVQDSIHHYITDFLLPNKPDKVDRTIEFVWEREPKFLYLNLEKEAYINLFRIKNKDTIICFYRISILQFEILLRFLLLDLLKKQGGIMLHASGIKTKKGIYLFLGNSGAGKSTIVQLIKDVFIPFSDDNCIIKLVKNQYLAYQTPFFEKNFYFPKKKGGYPVLGICFLKKSNECKIQKIPDKEFIYQQLVLNSDVSNKFIKKQIASITILLKNYFYFYLFRFKKNKRSITKTILDIETINSI